jgi:3-oxoacyl-[acyl-carrier-protein] synthase III
MFLSLKKASNKRCFTLSNLIALYSMANRQMTQKKRAREQGLLDHREDKAAKKAARAEEKAARDALKAQGIDPDLAGIVPGPHNAPSEFVS